MLQRLRQAIQIQDNQEQALLLASLVSRCNCLEANLTREHVIAVIKGHTGALVVLFSCGITGKPDARALVRTKAPLSSAL